MWTTSSPENMKRKWTVPLIVPVATAEVNPDDSLV